MVYYYGTIVLISLFVSVAVNVALQWRATCSCRRT